MPNVQTQILPANSIEERKLTYVVIAAREEEKWVFVSHRERTSWELPAGHIEKGESADHAAHRELFEETGTLSCSLKHLCDYRVSAKGKDEWGRLYFAEIHQRNPQLEYEIDELLFSSVLPASLSYPEVQSVLFGYANELLRS